MGILGLVILIVIVLALVGGGWGYRAGYYSPGPYHYGAGGLLGLLLIILLVLFLTGYWR